MPARKLLCLADGNPEARTAVMYAAQRAQLTQAGLVILRVVEPMDPALWASMGERLREEIRAEAIEDLAELGGVAGGLFGIEPELVVREGETDQQIRALIDSDAAIKTLVLAAGAGRGGPGPLVSAATRGGFGFGRRAVVIMIVPEGLSDTDLIDLAR